MEKVTAVRQGQQREFPREVWDRHPEGHFGWVEVGQSSKKTDMKAEKEFTPEELKEKPPIKDFEKKEEPPLVKPKVVKPKVESKKGPDANKE